MSELSQKFEKSFVSYYDLILSFSSVNFCYGLALNKYNLIEFLKYLYKFRTLLLKYLDFPHKITTFVIVQLILVFNVVRLFLVKLLLLHKTTVNFFFTKIQTICWNFLTKFNYPII